MTTVLAMKVSIKRYFTDHADFLLLSCLFITFRLSTVWFLRPGGYIRDYSDLIYYQTRASWQDFGLLPYRDYWSEYPPLFAWLTVWIDRFSRQIPLWEDERLWYAVPFGLIMVIAESVTFLALYWLARRLYGHDALRVSWLYAGLFVPVYLLGGWFDALPVATILVCLVIAVARPRWGGALLFGLVAGIGGLLKLVPLAIVGVLPLATARRHIWILSLVTALFVVALGYGLFYEQGPVMTLASMRSLSERSGWSTLYAWSNGYTRLGKVLGDVFDPTVSMHLYTSWYPERVVWLGWLLIGLFAFIFTLRQEPPPQSTRRLVGFSALTYAILLLAYPAWNPQYVLYLLPFLILLWPGARGLLYALLLSALILLEHPIYHNLLGPDYPPAYANLVEADYKQLFLLIIMLRTLLLAVITSNLALQLYRPQTRAKWLPVVTAAGILALLLWSTPQLVQAYAAGRLATSPLRPLVRLLDTTENQWPVVTQQLGLGRELRSLLATPQRLVHMGGRPGRVEPLPTLLAQGPFLYIQAANDDSAIAPFADERYACMTNLTVAQWLLWYCNGASPQATATFAEAIDLLGTSQPVLVKDRLHLTLLWRSEAPVATDYTVFVHVMDRQGQMVGQWDQVPDAGAAPTSTWVAHRVIVDDYQVPLNLAEGIPPYQVMVGLYTPTTGERLAVLHSTQSILPESRLQLYELVLP